MLYTLNRRIFCFFEVVFFIADPTIIIANNIILFEMHAGCSTDGEWNSIRSKGRKRPISIFEIRSRVRRTYQRLGITKLRGMITPIGEHMHATCICIDCYDHV